jgi:hypothetical protein
MPEELAAFKEDYVYKFGWKVLTELPEDSSYADFIDMMNELGVNNDDANEFLYVAACRGVVKETRTETQTTLRVVV